MVDMAILNGINYFDTAWGYHNGNSELVIREALSGYPRSTFYLAHKFPGYDLSNIAPMAVMAVPDDKKTSDCTVEAVRASVPGR